MIAYTGSEAVRLMLAGGLDGKKIKQAYIADVLNMSPQVFTDKLRRDTFKFTEVIKIAMWLNYKITVSNEVVGAIECKSFASAAMEREREDRKKGTVREVVNMNDSDDEDIDSLVNMVREVLSADREGRAATKKLLAESETDDD